MPNKEGECCPKFEPSLWNGKETTWDNKLFIRESVPQFMHMPLPGTFGKAVHRMWEKINSAGVAIEGKDFLMLAQDPSPWKSNIYINTSKEVPNADNVRLSGVFISKVFDGSFNAIPKYAEELRKYVESKGKKVIDYYFYYTTCPKCVKKYGHNYIVAFAKVK